MMAIVQAGANAGAGAVEPAAESVQSLAEQTDNDLALHLCPTPALVAALKLQGFTVTLTSAP